MEIKVKSTTGGTVAFNVGTIYNDYLVGIDGLLIEDPSVNGGIFAQLLDPVDTRDPSDLNQYLSSYHFTTNSIYRVSVQNTPFLGNGRIVAAIAVPISGAETGTPKIHVTPHTGARILGTPPSLVPVTKSLKAKFVFDGSKADTVTYVGTIKLPSDFDITKTHDFAISLSTVIVNTTIDGKGKGTSTSNPGVLKTLKIQYKGVKKGTLTKGGEDAIVTATYSKAGLIAAGFLYDGIDATLTDIKPGATGSRHIQVAMLFDGFPYFIYQPANFTLSKDSKTGTLALPKK